MLEFCLFALLVMVIFVLTKLEQCMARIKYLYRHLEIVFPAEKNKKKKEKKG